MNCVYDVQKLSRKIIFHYHVHFFSLLFFFNIDSTFFVSLHNFYDFLWVKVTMVMRFKPTKASYMILIIMK